MAAFGLLEWSFTIFVGAMTVLAGLGGLDVLVQVFRNPGRG